MNLDLAAPSTFSRTSWNITLLESASNAMHRERNQGQGGTGTWLSVGNHSKHGKCGSAPTQKTSGEQGWRAGPTSVDKFSSGKSGLHCTQTAMRLALAKKLPHPELRKEMFTEYFCLPRIWARPSRYGT